MYVSFQDCAVCPGSSWQTRGSPQLAYIIGRRLIDGAAFETFLPKVTTAHAEAFDSDNNEGTTTSECAVPPCRFRVVATATAYGATNPSKSSAVVWWNHSPNRTYNSPSQPKWKSVAMTGPLSNLSSPWIYLPDDSGASVVEAAWFVEISTPPSEIPHTPSIARNFTDASPVRFAFRTPSKAGLCVNETSVPLPPSEKERKKSGPVATLLFGKGTMTPGGALYRANEPSLLLLPPADAGSNGTLLAVAGGESAANPKLGRALVLRRSEDGGASWSPISFPFGTFRDAQTVGSFFQSQLTFDAKNKVVLLTIGNITSHLNTCGNGPGNTEDEDGLLQITSIDRGVTWSAATTLSPADAPTSCLAPTTGHGVSMTNGATPAAYRGRVLMAAVHNAYHGDVIVFSDDGGKTFGSSGTSLHTQGLDEVSIAQLPNGSLAAIIRNCMPGTGSCQMEEGEGDGGGGGKHFMWTTSEDGGETWVKPRPHADLITPVCQGSLLGYNNTLLFVGPYSTTSRQNLTALASDDNGKTFTRSLVVWPGDGGYSSLQCGVLEGGGEEEDDCAVLFDGAGSACDGICFTTFDSRWIN